MHPALVLVVEDRDSIRSLVSSLLAEEGYAVMEASNGAEAVEAVRLHRPDLVLMDLEMPIMDGFEACRKLRAREETVAIPVLAVTALDYSNHLDQLQDGGFSGYLRKPYTVTRILGAVAEGLASRTGRAA